VNIYEKQLTEGLMLSKMPQFRLKVDKALKDIKIALSLSKNQYVALSWGKQSSVLMHLVFRVNQKIPGVFWRGPESDIIANFTEVSKQFINKWNIIYIEQYCEEDFKNTARDWQINNMMDCVFMGLCEHESNARRCTLGKADKNNIFHYKNNTIRCCPLKTWSNMDIAAYVAQNNIPMLKTYHKFGFDARTAARIKFGTSFTELGFDLLSGREQGELLEAQKKRKEHNE
jgi:3'-phosphoadenosine 5'-phosphosulfate sulfotransferase (PAPS reductase)/FAD synthetase